MFFLFIVSAEAQVKYIHCGELLDMTSENVQSEMTIIVEGDLILQVVHGYLEGNDEVEYIDLKDKFVMPGFMDNACAH